MEREKKLRMLKRSLGDPSRSLKGAEAVFFCPRCPPEKRKPKLSVNLDSDNFHCWVCDFSGRSLVPLLRIGGNRDDIRAYIDMSSGASAVAATVQAEKQYDSPVLPSEFRTLSKEYRSPYYRLAIDYLRGRGVHLSDILRWKLGYCEDGEYAYRIIFPSFDSRGELNFFVGRLFFGAGVKYKHGKFSKDIIFNDYMIDWSEPVILTEGPFDALKARDNAIALQGNDVRIGSALFNKIVVSSVPVFFALDSDATERQLGIIETFMQYGTRCFCVELGGRKDVGEMTHDEFLERKASAIEVVSSLSLLKARLST